MTLKKKLAPIPLKEKILLTIEGIIIYMYGLSSLIKNF